MLRLFLLFVFCSTIGNTAEPVPAAVADLLRPLSDTEPAAVVERLARPDVPDHALVHLIRAQALHRLGRTDEADKAYRACLERDPTQRAAHAGLAQLTAAANRWTDCLSECGAAFDPSSASADELRLWATAAIEANDPGVSDRIMSIAIVRFPANQSLRRLEAHYFVRSGRHAEAERAIQHLLTQMPQDAELWTVLADLMQERGDISGALAALEAALLADPTHAADRQVRLASLELAYERPHAAWSRLSKPAAADPPNPIVIALAARAAGAINDPQAGRKLIARLPATQRSRDLHVLDARLAIQAGDQQAARDTLATMLANGEHDPQVLTWAGALAEQTGDLAAAETYFRAAISTTPNDGPANLRLAAVLARTGRMAEARTVVSTVLAREPSDQAAQAMAAALDARANAANRPVAK